MKCSECLVQTMCDELNCDYFLERIGLERVMDDAVVFKVNINKMNDYPKYISKKIRDYISEKKIGCSE